ncbi:hypothetical protein AYX14_03415 [Cryptococcus neoformans]|nr:hypothetical protein AYX15_06761 [Cryptococcus neoformans var. grubii]OWZ71141.1 hypothetical protein AYX14_03415 [Cryptococcus neoformans var. grubii]OWZ78475.1 hypothetical protein C365_03272 [Cryptococcus neoformans var. grubii Bt85]OXG19005.1 hypothetical protein C366_03118 [Cryptococcus neoformans var. grubii Tu401-1]
MDDPTTQARPANDTFKSTDPSRAVPAPVPTPADINNQRQQQQQNSAPEATGIRQRVNKLSHSVEGAASHPAVRNAKQIAANQTRGLRERLGRSPTIMKLEKRTGIDRVALVGGGVLLYILLIPVNIFHLALPTTQLLTILPAAYLSAQVLDSSESGANDEKVKILLSFFVVLGCIQTLESLMAGFLEKRIPQYYTVKLLFLAYLLHPKTQGAKKIHESVFRPLIKNRDSPLSPTNVYPSSTSKTDASTTGSTNASVPSHGEGTGTPPTSRSSNSNVASSPIHSNNPFISDNSPSKAVPQSTSAINSPDFDRNFGAPSSTFASSAGSENVTGHQAPTLAQLQATTGSAAIGSNDSSFPPPRVQAQQALAHAVQDSGVDTTEPIDPSRAGI